MDSKEVAGRAAPPSRVLIADLDANVLRQSFGADELAACMAVRGHPRTPVIVSGASGAEADVVRALNLGADDYVTKLLGERAQRIDDGLPIEAALLRRR
jgi:CheY-like chemotaxis protein